MTTREETAVVIIGAGVAGLTLATLLQAAGIACVVLERRDRSHVETRQRAGVVDARNVRMFERAGLADKLLAGPVAQTIEYRVNGVGRVFELIRDDAGEARFCTQQMLVNNLLRVLIDERGGDVRFEVNHVAIRNEANLPPLVGFADVRGAYEIACDYVVGCDADRGVSRASIPAGVLTTVVHDFDYAWISALVEAPVGGHPIMGVSDHGFVAQLPRGPHRSRYHLQCSRSDCLEDWPDARLWDEIRLRTGDSSIDDAVVHDKDVVPLRSVMHAPLQYGRLYLAGDAAHLVPPTGGKGMNLALFDVDVLSQALIAALNDGATAALAHYSDAVLPHLWRYQAFSVWMTDTMHDAGDATLRGRFRQMIARAQLDELFSSPSVRRLHNDYLMGLA